MFTINKLFNIWFISINNTKDVLHDNFYIAQFGYLFVSILAIIKKKKM